MRFHADNELMPALQSYRDLRVWQKAMELARECYAVCGKLPVEERFVLSAQLRRASISVPANLAEGYARKGRREYLHFISIAQGSLAELECQLQLVDQLGLVATHDVSSALDLAGRVGRMLRRLEQALRVSESRAEHLL